MRLAAAHLASGVMPRLRQRRCASAKPGYCQASSRVEPEAMTLVRERMSPDVAAIRSDATLIEAARRMRASGVGGLPVEDPSGSIVGIVTERDIIVRALAEGRDARAGRVREVATIDPVTCAPEDDLRTAVGRMQKYEVQHLPVVEHGSLVGVISLADIVFERPDEDRGSLDVDFRDEPR
jgi:CBS domain-containing protein